MQQLIGNLSDGTINVLDLPPPNLSSSQLLIRSSVSLISSGTERMLLEFGKSNVFDKARKHPDKVKQVIEKIRVDGLLPTIDSVNSKLDQPLPLGYCNVGKVVKVSPDVTGFKVGDRVVSNGPHSELVAVPSRLCALIPDSVSDETASFTILGAIALQGVRLASPSFGETFLVSGLGLIGLLACQILLANGCQVLAMDTDSRKCALAKKLGVKALHLGSGVDPVLWCHEFTNGVGVDGVLIAASTSSNDPLRIAAESCRYRGRIILIGVAGLELRRDLFYKKELSFQVSCSYGPGRYDPSYEQRGHDYPIGFVRWTEERNFHAVLNSFAAGGISTDELISHSFSIDNAPDAYDLLSSSEPSLGILIKYPQDTDFQKRDFDLPQSSSSCDRALPVLSFIGAGNYSTRMLMPAFARAGAQFHTLAASSGIGPAVFGKKYGFCRATTDIPSLFDDANSNCIVIATRHDSHADLVEKSLSAGKHVFVENPLCLTSSELTSIESALSSKSILTVGFNRRFAPLVLELREQLSSMQGPKTFVYTCNAGAIPADHWTQDPAAGGGRLLGEACHFVDLLRHLAASPIEDLQLISAADPKPCPDTFSLQLRFADGSIGTVHYFANGSKSFPKERLEVFADGKVLQLDNFRKLKAWGIHGFRTRRLLSQNKGQEACCEAFLKAIETGGSPPIPVEEIFEVQRWLLRAVNR